MNCPYCKQELTDKDRKRICKNAESQKHGAAGGKVRAKKLSAKRRAAIAKKAAEARWKDRKEAK
jgi:hypothetical protein